MDIYQFSYSERIVHSKRYLKGNFYGIWKKNYYRHFLLRETLPKPKISLPNFDSINYSVVNNYYYSKSHLKGNIYLRKIIPQINASAVFSRYALPEAEIRLPNLYFYEFLRCKRLITSKTSMFWPPQNFLLHKCSTLV